MSKKKTRHYVAWQLDRADNKSHSKFIKTLSPEERTFFDKFEAEFVRAEFSEQPLHDALEDQSVSYVNRYGREALTTHKKSRQNAIADARYDFLNSESNKIAEVQHATPHKNTNKAYYVADDYKVAEKSPEDALIDAIDQASSKQ